MARKEEKTSLCGILMVLAAIAVGVFGRAEQLALKEEQKREVLGKGK